MRKVDLLPTRDCEAGYGPDWKGRLKVPNDVLNSSLHHNWLSVPDHI